MDAIGAVYARIISRHLLEQGVSSEDVFAGTALDYDELYAQDQIALESFSRL